LDIVVLDVRDLSSICDYFVICSGDSTTQVEAIYRGILKSCKKDKIKVHHFERGDDLNWVLVDLSDVILHIF